MSDLRGRASVWKAVAARRNAMKTWRSGSSCLSTQGNGAVFVPLEGWNVVESLDERSAFACD